MIISTIANWYGAVRSALRAMLFGLPAPGDSQRGMAASRLAKMREGRPSKTVEIPTVSQAEAAELELGANQHTPIGAPSQRQGERTDLPSIEGRSQPQAAEPPETACQPPESTPGSFNWMRTHNFAATDRDLQCADCGMRWPEAPQEPHT